MYEHEKLNLMVAMKEHFNKATDGDGEILWADLKFYDLADAKRAIEEHRREKGAQAWRPDPARVKSLAAKYRNDRRRANYADERIIDSVRKTAVINGDTSLCGDDVAGLTLHFSRCWAETKKKANTDHGRNSIRALIFNHAKHGFGEVGLSQSEAEGLARDCVELANGERIMLALPRGGDAKMLIGHTTTPLNAPASPPALKKLAIAEHEAGAA
jgi:hypothetical protein